jgi:uncharacterized membrane protein HdeD (DUF308 family)
LNILKQPSWLRSLEIVTGLLAIVFGVLVLVYPGWGVGALIILLSIGLIFAGVSSVSLAGYSLLPNGIRAMGVISGILCLILALLVIIFPGFGVSTLIIIVSFGLLIYGVSRIYLSSTLKGTEGWIRGMLVAVGVIDIILSVAVIVLPNVALLTLAYILAFVLIISGVETIISGAVGRTWLGEMVKAASNEMS